MPCRDPSEPSETASCGQPCMAPGRNRWESGHGLGSAVAALLTGQVHVEGVAASDAHHVVRERRTGCGCRFTGVPHGGSPPLTETGCCTRTPVAPRGARAAVVVDDCVPAGGCRRATVLGCRGCRDQSTAWMAVCPQEPRPRGGGAGALAANSAGRLGGVLDEVRDDPGLTEHHHVGRGGHFDDLAEVRTAVHPALGRGRDRLVAAGD